MAAEGDGGLAMFINGVARVKYCAYRPREAVVWRQAVLAKLAAIEVKTLPALVAMLEGTALNDKLAEAGQLTLFDDTLEFLRSAVNAVLAPDPDSVPLPTEDVVWYVATGSCLSEERLRARVGAVGGMAHIDAGMQSAPVRLEGFFLTFHKRAQRGYGGYATLEESPARPDDPGAEGVLYPLTAKAIAKLDVKEGISSDSPHYRKVTDWSFVHPEYGPVKAVAYQHCEHVYQRGLLPRRDYLNHLLAAKGLSDEYMTWLRAHPVCDEPTSLPDGGPVLRAQSSEDSVW